MGKEEEVEEQGEREEEDEEEEEEEPRRKWWSVGRRERSFEFKLFLSLTSGKLVRRKVIFL